MDVSEVRTRQVAGELFADKKDLMAFAGYKTNTGFESFITDHTTKDERMAHVSPSLWDVSVALINIAISRAQKMTPNIHALRYFCTKAGGARQEQLNLELDDTEQVPFALSFEDLLKGYDRGIITGEQLVMLMAIKED